MTFAFLDDLDKFALLACQGYNLGNRGNWFGAWRGGYFGAGARVNAAVYHYDALHHAGARFRDELHLADLLFCMDSAFECSVFALNSLGHATRPDLFLAPDNAVEIRWVGLASVWSEECRCGKDTKAGYEQVFPSFARWWNDHRSHIDLVCGNHDVAKHRAAIYKGGKYVTTEEHENVPMVLRAMEEIFLAKDPKTPYGDEPGEFVVLERDVWPVFLSFIAKIPSLVLADVRTTIQLREQEFRSAD